MTNYVLANLSSAYSKCREIIKFTLYPEINILPEKLQAITTCLGDFRLFVEYKMRIFIPQESRRNGEKGGSEMGLLSFRR